MKVGTLQGIILCNWNFEFSVLYCTCTLSKWENIIIPGLITYIFTCMLLELSPIILVQFMYNVSNGQQYTHASVVSGLYGARGSTGE